MGVLGFLTTRPPAEPGVGAPASARAADWDQWHAARRGDAAAARALVHGLTGQALGLALRMLGRAEDAEDVVQEAFMRLWRSDPRDDAGATIATYFNTIVLNRCRTLLVSRREWATDPDDLPGLQEASVAAGGGSPHVDAPGARLDEAQRRDAIDRALKHLPVRQRMVIAMWAYADRSVPEIAADMELGIDAAHQLLTRAKRALRQHLQADAQGQGLRSLR
jgi:RNA polymerase sigma-70 factor, ECF subfamily